MLEIFKIMALIGANNDEAIDKMDDTADKGKSLASKLSSGLGTAAKVVGAASVAAVSVASAAVTSLVKSSVESYAEYEQLAGGTELMFGDAYEFVMGKSKEAYKNVQMSQNDYLQQVNGFAVGLKTALGGNEQAAAELADKIITAEADVVAATGNSQEAVQNAFNGIMKSNFTMLDNLQIGITPTKEGFQEVIDKVNDWNAANGNATEYQIENLADCQAALVDYIEMQGLAGYAADEASKTIQGSLASVKGAWANLKTSIATGEDIGQNIKNLFDVGLEMLQKNIIPRISEIMVNIGEAVKEAAPMLAEIFPILVNDILPVLLDSALILIKALIPVLVENIPMIVTSIVDILIESLPVLIEGAVQLFMGLVLAIPIIIEKLWEALPEIGNAIIQSLAPVPDMILGMFGTSVDNVKKKFEPLTDFFSKTWNSIVDSLKPIIEAIQKAFEEAWEVIQIIWNAVKPYFEMVWNNVKAIFSVVKDVLGNYFKMAWENIKAIWNVVTAYFKAVWESIASIFSVVKDILAGDFKSAWEEIKHIVSIWADYFKTVWENIKAIFGNVKTFFKDSFESAWEGIKQVFSNVGTFFGGLWNTIKDKFSNLGTSIAEAIGDAVKSGINGIIGMIESTINKAIGLINGAIKLINKLPGVNVSSISEVELPRLAKGGVLEKGQVGLLEGDGSEAVVPLENNRKWIARVSEDMKSQGIGGDSESTGLLKDILALLQSIKANGDDLPETLVDSMATGLKFNINNREFARLVKVVN